MSMFSKLASRRAKLNRSSYKPLVYRSGKKVDFSDTEEGRKNLEDYKTRQIALIDRMMGGRSPTRKTIRKITGFEKEMAEREIGKPAIGGIAYASGPIEGDLKTGVVKATGGVKALYGQSEKESYLVQAEEITIDPRKKGLSAIDVVKTKKERSMGLFGFGTSLQNENNTLG